MLEKLEQFDMIAGESEERLKNEEILAELVGFKNLSEDQQRYLCATLYIQQRAERGTDVGSAAQINPVPEQFKSYSDGPYISSLYNTIKNAEPNAYTKSQKYVMEEYCHNAVVELATRGMSDFNLENNEWCDGGDIKTFDDLQTLLEVVAETSPAPWVLQACYYEKNDFLVLQRMHHTLVVLGRDKQGKYIAWEKSGFGLPFALIDLQRVYGAYSYCNLWRVLPLPTKK